MGVVSLLSRHWVFLCLFCMAWTGISTAPARSDIVPLPIDADRCAISMALVGGPVEGCGTPDFGQAVLRSVEQAAPGTQTGGYSVNFSFDSSGIEEAARNHLTELGQILMTDLKDLCVLLVGHADSTGPAEYNLVLSQQRATSVRLFLAGPSSVPSHRLRAMGRGEEDLLPNMKGADPRNRRVEVLAKRHTDGDCS